MNGTIEQRRYTRYTTDIPVLYGLRHADGEGKYSMRNVSQGGLCFRAARHIEPGTSIHVFIPICRPSFEVDGEVVWCQEQEGEYDLGIRFDEPTHEFGAWMVDQVRKIEQYKIDTERDQSRSVSGEQAAAEWIAMHPDLTPSAHV